MSSESLVIDAGYNSVLDPVSEHFASIRVNRENEPSVRNRCPEELEVTLRSLARFGDALKVVQEGPRTIFTAPPVKCITPKPQNVGYIQFRAVHRSLEETCASFPPPPARTRCLLLAWEAQQTEADATPLLQLSRTTIQHRKNNRWLRGGHAELNHFMSFIGRVGAVAAAQQKAATTSQPVTTGSSLLNQTPTMS